MTDNLLKMSLIFLITGCTSVQFKSSKIIPITFKEKDKHIKEVKVTVSKQFFLLGLIPNQHEVDRVFQEKGYESVADVSIKTEKSFTDLLWSVFTFGFYYPRTYTLIGNTIL